ncbi:MAG: radical SAM protein [Cyclobacteriaceae bacterium]|nr:radical SAM protein [Cyclobacteriaceae bacterium]
MIYHLAEAKEFISKITVKRLLNAMRTYWGFKLSLRSKSPWHPAFPFSISVEPTTSCNLRCPQCPSGLRSFSRPTGMMPMETYRKIIDELHGNLMYLILYFQGEPYLHPGFFDLINYAHSKKIFTATSTNAHFLTPENAKKTIASGLNRIIVSLDGTGQATYEKYRIGGQLSKAIVGIENLIAARKSYGHKHPFIILQFIVFEHNRHQIGEVKALAKRLGVDKLELKTAQVYDFEKGSELIPKDRKYSRYTQIENNKIAIKNKHLNKCWKMWHSCVMTWNGDIVPCCFDKDARYTMGNIHDRSFKEIWNGKQYLNFRSRLLSDRKGIDICKNCTEGLEV